METAESYGYAFMSITVISLTALSGVVLVPFMKTGAYQLIMAFAISIAVSTLSGDALLHLIPHALGLHLHANEKDVHDAHSTEEGHNSMETTSDNHLSFDANEANAKHNETEFLWKMVAVLAAVYLFFLFEWTMHYILDCVKHGSNLSTHADIGPGGTAFTHDHHHHHNPNIHGTVAMPKICSSDLNHACLDTSFETEQNGANINGNATCFIRADDISVELSHDVSFKHVHLDTQIAPDNLSATTDDAYPKSQLGHQHVHIDDGPASTNKKPLFQGMTTTVIMVLIGDSVHNFADGLAVGAAFSQDLATGIGTSVAVLCHELPHEFGDFAICVSNGMTYKGALFLNFLSALTAYIGMFLGVAVSSRNDELSSWIFCAIAGMFLYISLVEMLPELLHQHSDHKCLSFLMMNCGLVIGFAIMGLLAFYEESLISLTS